MKKRGFTLAEVMIALALIGVVTSLTIPTFIANSRNKANASRLAAVISSVENTFTTMIASEAVHDLSETEFGSSQTEEKFGKYMKLAGSGTSLSSYYGVTSPFKTLNQVAVNPNVTRIFQTKNGALIIFYSKDIAAPTDGSHPGSLGHVTIDVNGSAKPNIWGRDVFLFRLGYDGLLYPAGGKMYTKMDTTGSSYKCDGSTKNQGCTARLIENNYEIDF